MGRFVCRSLTRVANVEGGGEVGERHQPQRWLSSQGGLEVNFFSHASTLTLISRATQTRQHAFQFASQFVLKCVSRTALSKKLTSRLSALSGSMEGPNILFTRGHGKSLETPFGCPGYLCITAIILRWLIYATVRPCSLNSLEPTLAQ